MQQNYISYVGPPIDDSKLLDQLPESLVGDLRLKNGWVLAGGTFHVRGACLDPHWHSMRAAWEGALALFRLYPEVTETDIPLAEDCFGDQYMIRDSKIIQLYGETGEIVDTGLTWEAFAKAVERDPIGFLEISLFQSFLDGGGVLLPEESLSVYPPFVAKECVNPSLRPVPRLERRSFLADFARQIRNVPDGQSVRIVIS